MGHDSAFFLNSLFFNLFIYVTIDKRKAKTVKTSPTDIAKTSATKLKKVAALAKVATEKELKWKNKCIELGFFGNFGWRNWDPRYEWCWKINSVQVNDG